MGVLVWVFSAILASTLLSSPSLALTQDGIFILHFFFKSWFFLCFCRNVCSFCKLHRTNVFCYHIWFLGITLLEFKVTLNDTQNYLSNWNDSDETPCDWTGVTCNPVDNTVYAMYATHTPFFLHLLTIFFLCFIAFDFWAYFLIWVLKKLTLYATCWDNFSKHWKTQ